MNRTFSGEEGFEPPVPFGTMVFKTTAFDHSAISPAEHANVKYFYFLHQTTSILFSVFYY